jgi:hypothetical protein
MLSLKLPVYYPMLTGAVCDSECVQELHKYDLWGDRKAYQ